MRAHISNRDYEQLSAYLDGQLAPGEQKKLEERLRARPELKTALDELSQTRALLRMAPRRKAPRNFTLTPAMVGDTGPGRKAARSGGFFANLNLFPALSFASAVAALLLVAVIVFDIAPRPAQTTFTNQAVPQAPGAEADTMRMENSAEGPASATANDTGAEPPSLQMAMPESDQVPGAAPPVINWGYGGMGGVPGGRGGGAGPMGGGDGNGPMFSSGQPGINGVPLNNAPEGLGGGFVLPPAADGIMEKSNLLAPDPAPEPAAGAEAPSAAPAEAQPAITGTGPILGVPQPGQSGQVIDAQGIMGYPDQVPPAAPGVSNDAGATTQREAEMVERSAFDRLREQQALGMPLIRLIQILLLVVMITTGIAAAVYRRQHGR